MIKPLSEFEQKRYKKIAEHFVTLHIDVSPTDAQAYVKNKVPSEWDRQLKLKPYITEEFNRRGYTL